MAEVSYQKKTADKAKLLASAKENWRRAEEFWSDTRKTYVECVKFLSGDQWPERIKQQRERENRPVMVVDKLNQYLRQVSNSARQNRPQAKVYPVGNDGDEDVAEAFSGIIRGIWNRSTADEATDWALYCAAAGGIGFIRVLTEYVDDDSFDQEIVIRRVRNPMSCMLDPTFQMADGSDAEWGFITEDLTKEEFKARFPEAKETNWESEKFSNGWLQDGQIRVCEYFYKVKENRLLLQLADGTTVSEEEYLLAGQNGAPTLPVVRKEQRPVKVVKWCRMTGGEILEERDWLGKYIPIIPIFGEERNIDGKIVYTGLTKPGHDAQRVYNYSRTAFVERVALTPKAPWLAAFGQVEDAPEWDTANTGNHQVLRYTPVDVAGTPVPPPSRVDPSDTPIGFQQDMQLAEHDIQGALGMYQASLGQESNEKSGKAIIARRQQGDVATFHFADNLNRAVRYIGKILVDLIPKVYDTKRVVRILGEDGSAEAAQIDPEQEVAMQKIPGQNGMMTVYNLGVGQYDVDVQAGPSYGTKRQEAADSMMQLTQANPAMFNIIGDIMVRNMDWPGAEEIANRLKLMLPPQIQQAEQKDAPSPEAMQVMNQAQQVIGQLQQQIQAAEQGIAERDQAMAQMKQELDSKLAEHEEAERETAIKAYDAETKRLAALAPAISPEQIQAVVVQTLQQLATPADLGAPETEQVPEGAEYGGMNG